MTERDSQTTKRKRKPCDQFPQSAKEAHRATHLNQAIIMRALATVLQNMANIPNAHHGTGYYFEIRKQADDIEEYYGCKRD